MSRITVQMSVRPDIKKEAQKDLNLKCPKCKEGKITIKRSRKGIF